MNDAKSRISRSMARPHMQESYRKYESVVLFIWLSHVTHMNESLHTYVRVFSRIWTSHVTQLKIKDPSGTWRVCSKPSESFSDITGFTGVCNGDTEWRRLIGSPKFQIIFHKRATNYRALLRKMTYKDKASYASPQACMRCIYMNLNLTICTV